MSCSTDKRTNTLSWADPEGAGGRGSGPRPLKNHKNIEFPSRTCPDRLKIHNAIKPASMFGHHRPASERPYKWRFAGGPMMAHF